jgi:hypothetical protein
MTKISKGTPHRSPASKCGLSNRTKAGSSSTVKPLTKHIPKEYMCTYCPRSFNDKKESSAHAETHKKTSDTKKTKGGIHKSTGKCEKIKPLLICDKYQSATFMNMTDLHSSLPK